MLQRTMSSKRLSRNPAIRILQIVTFLRLQEASNGKNYIYNWPYMQTHRKTIGKQINNKEEGNRC